MLGNTKKWFFVHIDIHKHTHHTVSKDQWKPFNKHLANPFFRFQRRNCYYQGTIFLYFFWISVIIRVKYLYFSEKKIYSNPLESTPLLFSCSVVSDPLRPMDCSTPGFPVLHRLPELVHAHVHWVSDAIYSSRPLLSQFPPAFDISKQRGLFKWVSSLHQVAKHPTI